MSQVYKCNTGWFESNDVLLNFTGAKGLKDKGGHYVTQTPKTYLIWAKEAQTLWTDGKGGVGGISNNPIRELLEEYNIHHFVDSDLIKAGIFRTVQ